MEARGKMFPRITNGKVYVPIGGELEDSTMIDGLVELPPEDPSYDAIKAWLIQVEARRMGAKRNLTHTDNEFTGRSIEHSIAKAEFAGAQ
jgi:hypothetical protein